MATVLSLFPEFAPAPPSKRRTSWMTKDAKITTAITAYQIRATSAARDDLTSLPILTVTFLPEKRQPGTRVTRKPGDGAVVDQEHD
jgi:hypothetical protein